jgi:hypothetical protein
MAANRLTARLSPAGGDRLLCQQGEALNSVQPGETITLDMRRQTPYPRLNSTLTVTAPGPASGFFRLLFRNHYVSILFNQRASLVNDVIEGTIIASPWNNLARLESDPPSAWWSVAI